MLVIALQENLLKGLSTVGRAVATRPTLPITSHVLLSTDEGRLRLVATNLEMALTCWVPAKVEEEGAIALPYRLLHDFIAALPQDRVEIKLSPGLRQVSFQCGRYQARISGQDAQEFPPIPAAPEGASVIKLDGEVLRKAIRQVEFAAASDDTRPVLTGVHALIEGDRLTFAASDGFRLSVKYVPLSTPISERLEMVIPAAALRELARLVAEEDEPIEFIANPARGEVRFHLKNLQMMSKLIQGTFPDYSRFIPKSYATRVVVSAADLRQAIRSTAVFARDGAGIVRLQVTPGGELGPGRLTISARAEEAGENTVELDVAVEGQEAKIAFNNKYLQDVLNEIDAEQVAIQTETPSSPGVFVPTGRDDYTHVVMPMFVQW